MSSDVPIAVPSGYSPPFQVVDDSHHGAWVIIATALGLVIALVSFLIRVYVRVALNPPFAVDDGVLLGATVGYPAFVGDGCVDIYILSHVLTNAH